MKFRIKISEKRDGSITYAPQFKTSFFGFWKGFVLKFRIINTPKKYLEFDTEAKAITFIDMERKKQELNNKKTVTYKRIK
jgi:hypothetical protein